MGVLSDYYSKSGSLPDTREFNDGEYDPTKIETTGPKDRYLPEGFGIEYAGQRHTGTRDEIIRSMFGYNPDRDDPVNDPWYENMDSIFDQGWQNYTKSREYRKKYGKHDPSGWQGALPGQEVGQFASAGDLNGMLGSNRLTPDILKGSGYGKFVDTDTLPEVIAHKQREKEAYSAWEKANQYRSSYLGGRSAGTQGEFEEWQRRAASADSAFGRYESISQQGMDALHSGLNTWGKQHNLRYSGGEWSWINQNVAEFNNGYDTWMSKDNPYTDFNVAGYPYVSDDSDLKYNFTGEGSWVDDDDAAQEILDLIGPGGGFDEATIKQFNRDQQNKNLMNKPNVENIASDAVVRRSSSNNNVMKIKSGSSSGTLGTGVVV